MTSGVLDLGVVLVREPTILSDNPNPPMRKRSLESGFDFRKGPRAALGDSAG